MQKKTNAALQQPNELQITASLQNSSSPEGEVEKDMCYFPKKKTHVRNFSPAIPGPEMAAPIL